MEPARPDERTGAMLAHLSFFAFGIFGPIILMLTKGKESDFVRDQAVEAFNFHVTVALAFLVSAVLIIVAIGVVLMIAVAAAGTVLAIMGARAANRGERYRYPIALRIIA